ncbi:MAG: hypothetical protein KAR15_08530 [Desulfobacterales bacterium]|nr:hypothetical protein [Desulfobacterales bacterium]
MESNQMTCPQCGLVNHYLSEACAQCGIIFVKNHAVQMQADRDEQKRKAIEEAEAILEQSDPAAGNDPANNETVERPDPAEDTIEMAIPVEHQASENKSEAPSADATKSEENQEADNHEIEMEAIETSIEMVTDTMDAEELFLSEVKPGKPAETQKPEVVGKPAESPTDPETAVESSDKTGKSDTAEEENSDQKKDDPVAKQPEDEPAAATQPEEDQKKKEPEEAKSEVAEPDKAGATELIKAKAPAAEVAEPASTEDKPAEKEIHFEEKLELTMVKDEPVQDKAQTHPNATIEMSKEPAEENVPAKNQEVEAKEEALKKQQETQVRGALKKQRETQAKAEALKKEKAAKAKAVALKRKKLAKVKVEALKKQKEAQAKAEALKKMEAQAKAKSAERQKTARAEALKKQKEAQAKAEASAQEIQIASTGVYETASQTTEASLNHHAKLLGLLKRYKGKAIGINYDNSSEIKEAELVDANEEFFSVMVKDKKLQYSYPLKNILTIVEGQEGVEIGEDDKKLKFDAVIKVYPLVSF